MNNNISNNLDVNAVKKDRKALPKSKNLMNKSWFDRGGAQAGGPQAQSLVNTCYCKTTVITCNC